MHAYDHIVLNAIGDICVLIWDAERDDFYFGNAHIRLTGSMKPCEGARWFEIADAPCRQIHFKEKLLSNLRKVERYLSKGEIETIVSELYYFVNTCLKNH